MEEQKRLHMRALKALKDASSRTAIHARQHNTEPLKKKNQELQKEVPPVACACGYMKI